MGGDERAKLRVLLNHWVEHNREHSQEFNEWADKAKALSEAEAGEGILQAAEAMDKASDFLTRALQKLGED